MPSAAGGGVPWSAIASIGGDLIGGMLGSSGESSANKVMRRFTRYMSDTAVQRRKADLLAAGFNPYLAVGDPASSPSVGQSNPAAPLERATSAASGKAIGMMQAKANVDLTRAQERSTNAQTEATQAAAEYTKWTTGKSVNMGELEIQARQAQIGLTEAQQDQVKESAALISMQVQGQEEQNAILEANKILSRLSVQQQTAVIGYLIQNEKFRNMLLSQEAEVSTGPMGKAAAYVRLLGESVGNLHSAQQSAKGLMEYMR